MEIVVSKIEEGKNSTLSVMTVNGVFFCYVLEDAHHEPKIWGETRIPSGTYPVYRKDWGKRFVTYKSKFGHRFAIGADKVDNFQGIEIHIGNTILDTHGCLLVGDAMRKVNGDFLLMKSTVAYCRLYELVFQAFANDEKVTLKVVR